MASSSGRPPSQLRFPVDAWTGSTWSLKSIQYRHLHSSGSGSKPSTSPSPQTVSPLVLLYRRVIRTTSWDGTSASSPPLSPRCRVPRQQFQPRAAGTHPAFPAHSRTREGAGGEGESALAGQRSGRGDSPLTLERPQVDKPAGDIPFDLGIEDIVVGDAKRRPKGRRCRCITSGWPSQRVRFDASWDRGQPWSSGSAKGRSSQADDPVCDGLRSTRCRWCDHAARSVGVRGRSAARGVIR